MTCSSGCSDALTNVVTSHLYREISTKLKIWDHVFADFYWILYNKMRIYWIRGTRGSKVKTSQLFRILIFFRSVKNKNSGKRWSFFTKIDKLEQARCAKKFSENTPWRTLRIHTSTWNQVYLVPVPWGSPHDRHFFKKTFRRVAPIVKDPKKERISLEWRIF